MRIIKIITRITTMTITKKYKFNFENADFCDVDFDNTDFTIFRLMKICEIHFQK